MLKYVISCCLNKKRSGAKKSVTFFWDILVSISTFMTTFGIVQGNELQKGKFEVYVTHGFSVKIRKYGKIAVMENKRSRKSAPHHVLNFR